jgi:hypothetical protein
VSSEGQSAETIRSGRNTGELEGQLKPKAIFWSDQVDSRFVFLDQPFGRKGGGLVTSEYRFNNFQREKPKPDNR